jgi:hypothetical protein
VELEMSSYLGYKTGVISVVLFRVNLCASVTPFV